MIGRSREPVPPASTSAFTAILRSWCGPVARLRLGVRSEFAHVSAAPSVTREGIVAAKECWEVGGDDLPEEPAEVRQRARQHA